MTVRELKDILKNFNDDENIIGEIAQGSCAGHGMYDKTSSALLLSITSKEKERIKFLQKNIDLWSKRINEENAEKDYNLPYVREILIKEKKELKSLLDKIPQLQYYNYRKRGNNNDC